MVSIPVPRTSYISPHLPCCSFSAQRNPKILITSSSSTLREIKATARMLSTSEGDGWPESAPGTAFPAPFPPIRVTKRVVLVRHGQSTWNAEGRIQGSSDFSVLTPKGEAQALTSRQMLINDSFDVCFASPLNRARRTAEIIWGSRGKALIMEHDLREIDLYSFQGLLKHEGKEKFGDAYRIWQVDAPNFSIDGHFPVRELWARARSCWDRILAHESKSVLVVAHNAVNQALIATSIGLETEHFRGLLQSNCGVSVLDFIPEPAGGSPHVCLNRLNQTPNSPVAAGSSDGRNASQQIVLVCHGSLRTDAESQKTAELLLDLKVSTILTSPRKAFMETSTIISKVQDAADCLGADCVPCYVDIKPMEELDVENTFKQLKRDSDGDPAVHLTWPDRVDEAVVRVLWDQSEKAWHSLLEELRDTSHPKQKNIVVVSHPVIHIALITHCLNLTKESMASFHLDEGSISVLDFPDGPTSRGVIRCVNYTAHLGRWSIPITRPT